VVTAVTGLKLKAKQVVTFSISARAGYHQKALKNKQVTTVTTFLRALEGLADRSSRRNV
jgi:hypothetical protein